MMALSIIKSSASLVSRFLGMAMTSSPLISEPLSSLALGATYASNILPTRAKHFDHHFLNRWMARDYKRRALVKKFYPERQRLLAMKKCAVLPEEFKEMVSEELHAYPRDSCHTRLKPRCILSSRPRWVIRKYRVSRIHYRLLADYNKLSGVLRATW